MGSRRLCATSAGSQPSLAWGTGSVPAARAVPVQVGVGVGVGSYQRLQIENCCWAAWFTLTLGLFVVLCCRERLLGCLDLKSNLFLP